MSSRACHRSEHARRGLRLGAAAGLVAVAGVLAALHFGRRAHGYTPAAATGRAPATSPIVPSTTRAPTPVDALPPAALKVQQVAPNPDAGAVGFSTDITVRFSTPLAPGTADPTLVPKLPGTWTLVTPTTLVFQPAGYLLPLSKFELTVPAGNAGPRGLLGQSLASSYSATFTVAGGSVLRLQQLLAELNYLPLRFEPSVLQRPREHSRFVAGGVDVGGPGTSIGARAPTAPASQVAQDAVEPTAAGSIAPNPQPGTFSWRYKDIPASLEALWHPGVDTVLVQGAVMAFESEHGLEDNAVLSSTFWADLLNAVAQHQDNTRPYDYVEVSTTIPETLMVWQDGTIIFRALANTGIPQAPTELGAFPVYARYVSATMSGYNPDGSYYYDPGIPDIAYFNGGDAVHGYLRAAYGFPQSLGCVELPYAAAAVVFNYDPIGTLVDVA